MSRTLLRANKALLAPYASKNKDAVPAHFRDPDDHWIGTNVHLLVILQNTKLMPADAGPKSWADLLEPKWKGKVAFTDPANSGSAYSNLTMLAQTVGRRRRRLGEGRRNCSPTRACSTARAWCSRASATANSRSACRSNMPATSGPRTARP